MAHGSGKGRYTCREPRFHSRSNSQCPRLFIAWSINGNISEDDTPADGIKSIRWMIFIPSYEMPYKLEDKNLRNQQDEVWVPEWWWLSGWNGVALGKTNLHWHWQCNIFNIKTLKQITNNCFLKPWVSKTTEMPFVAPFKFHAGWHSASAGVPPQEFDFCYGPPTVKGGYRGENLGLDPSAAKYCYDRQTPRTSSKLRVETGTRNETLVPACTGGEDTHTQGEDEKWEQRTPNVQDQKSGDTSGFKVQKWVCLKIVYPFLPNGFADHYPQKKWL